MGKNDMPCGFGTASGERVRLLGVILCLSFCAGGLSGCRSEAVLSAVSRLPATDAGEEPDPPTGPRPPVVCDPLGGGGPGGPPAGSGLRGNLYFVPGNHPSADSFNRLEEFYTRGTRANLTLLLSQLHVPTRAWDTGFELEQGSYLEDGAGNRLVERFAFSLESQIRLKADEAEGPYQFGILSDDGARLSARSAGNSGYNSVLIDANSEHAPRFDCAPSVVTMAQTTPLPVKVEYFQGPRYHIALVLFWRRIPEGGSLEDENCGRLTTAESVRARGWHALNPQNFLLPPGAPVEACGGSGQP